jgi:hypothetical protein
MLYYRCLCKYTFAQRRNRLKTYFSERIPVVKRRISVLGTRQHEIHKQVAGRWGCKVTFILLLRITMDYKLNYATINGPTEIQMYNILQ